MTISYLESPISNTYLGITILGSVLAISAACKSEHPTTPDDGTVPASVGTAKPNSPLPGSSPEVPSKPATTPTVPKSNSRPNPNDCRIPSPEILTQHLATIKPLKLADIPPKEFQDGFSILEGPVWVGDHLLVSQINGNAAPPPARILSYVPGTNTLTEVLANSGSNGLQLNPDGKLVGALHSTGTVSYLSIEGAKAEPISNKFNGSRFNSPNDLTFHSNGTLYFTDPSWQAPNPRPQTEERVYLVGLNQIPAAITAASMVERPNGISLSQDESRLYIGGTNGLYRFALNANGSVVPDSGIQLTVVPDGGVDGMTLDCAGNLYVTNGNLVRVLDTSEKEIASIEFDLQPTNVEVGGADGLTLFVTTLQTSGTKPALFSVNLAKTNP
ncbi:MAG: SMP-30/gluconolactonase/LRE family protein [Myxococcales bacterium]|nr:SMP-30/gluconolactonase/LRE family protein [Myxococcales bacterium]